MKPFKHNRRKFLSALSAARSDPFLPVNGFLFEPGLVYLNTGTPGPCRRETIEETKKAWEELET
jgi:hypothetical protein